MDQNMIPQPNQKVNLLSATWAAKASTKYENYLILVTEVGAYLPRAEHVTIYFIKDIISSKKKHVKQKVVRYLYVPQYEGLGLKEIYSHIDSDPLLKQYFPDLSKERARMPKQWIVNMLATLTGDGFELWVKDQIVARNLKRARQADKFIEVDKDIFDAFNKATSISIHRGSAHNMLQMGAKRRRTKTEKEADDLIVANKDKLLQSKIAKIAQLEKAVEEAQLAADQNSTAAEVVNGLQDKGIIKIDESYNVQLSTTGEYLNQLPE